MPEQTPSYIAVLIFAIVAFFIVRALISLQSSLKQVDRTLQNAGNKVENLNPLLQSLSNVGEIGEHYTKALKDRCLEEEKVTTLTRSETEFNKKELSQEIAEWIVLTLIISKNIFGRR